ncbi:hypothetical protein [Amycolatopsis thermoflava]|uniref:hypothetical protein n=1 Tax=Amycolatopsis thermoflava TaxID=84480 RepID=UPI00381333D3
MTLPEPTVQATEYTACALPEDHPDYWAYSVRVRYHGDRQWAVGDMRGYFDVDGNKSYGPVWRDGSDEPRTDEEWREFEAVHDAWRAAHRFDLDTALAVAKRVAAARTVNGRSVADTLAPRRKR